MSDEEADGELKRAYASYFNFVNRLASGLGVSVEPERGSDYR